MLALPLPSHPTLFPFYATLMCFLSQAPSELEREGGRGGMAALLPELGEGIVNFLFSPFRHGERGGGGILLLQSMAAAEGGGRPPSTPITKGGKRHGQRRGRKQ